MGGTIVYDSYAKLTGCEKIVQYFSERSLRKVNPYLLFSKEEAKEAASKKARARFAKVCELPAPLRGRAWFAVASLTKGLCRL